jgi:sugar O-acyltransferase (sialic acid O-acetyltransferase NeuD family)
MKRLFIIGDGGFGREVLAWALDVPVQYRDWHVCGFLDADSTALDGYDCRVPVIADPLLYQPCRGDYFICAIRHTAMKLRICRKLMGRGAQFITLIHPTAVIGSRCSIGVGCILCPGAVVTTDVRISNFVTVSAQTTIGHDAVIGEGCTLSGHCDVTGFASLGEGVFLGSHAVVLPHAKIGDYAIVDAGKVVLGKVKPGVTAMGVPVELGAGF